MKYYKYLLPELPTEIKNADWVYIGQPVIEPATFDENGDIISETVYGDGFMVDVIWKDSPNSEWDEYIVLPTNHRHWIMGMQDLWQESNS